MDWERSKGFEESRDCHWKKENNPPRTYLLNAVAWDRMVGVDVDAESLREGAP